jgi:WD40 repeat protein
VWLWDPVTGTPVGRPLTGHTGSVLAVAAVPLPDGRVLLATGSDDGSVRLWDPVTDTPAGRPLTGQTSGVLAVAAVPLPGARVLLATGGRDGSVWLWDPVTGTPVGRPLTGHTSSVWAVAAVSVPDGRTLLATGSDDGTTRLARLTLRESPRTDLFGGRRPVRHRPEPDSAQSRPASSAVPVLEVSTEHLATLVGAADGAWALLLADGRSYKAEGDVRDILWWAIKTVRFEAGELDDYDQSIHCLDRDAVIDRAPQFGP